MKLLRILALTLILTFFSLLLPTMVNAGTTRLGGLNLDGYCQSLNQGGVTLNNTTWTCQSGASIDMNSACQWQYPGTNAFAQQDIAGNPYSWSCYQNDGTTPTPTPTGTLTPTPTPTPTPVPGTRLGGMNLDGYCQSSNQGSAVLTNSTWSCTAGNTINLTSACQWQYPNTNAVAQQDIAGNPYTWSCYSGTTTTPTPTGTPTPTPTVSPTSTSTPTPTPISTLRVRRSIYALSPAEVQRLITDINTLQANGTYQDFINRHVQAMMTLTPANETGTGRNVAHRGPAFLPWHRAFIYEFEDALRTVDPTITLPYWPFETETPGKLPAVFSAAYFGGDGNPAQNDQITNNPFTWTIVRRIARDPDSQVTTLPTQSEVNTVEQYTIYDQSPWDETSSGIDMGLEGWVGPNNPWGMHNRAHGYIGGDMLRMEAVIDPIFFLVHANIDRLWWQWQQTHGITNYQPLSGGPVGHNYTDTLQDLLRTPTPQDVMNIQQDMGYTYQ